MSNLSSAICLTPTSKKKPKIQPAATCGPFYITEFKSLFEKYCTENGCQPSPVVKEEQYVRGSVCSSLNLNAPQLLISYKGTNRVELEKISYKNYHIENGVIVALQKLLVNITISILKLEFCNLTSAHIEILSDLFTHSSSIVDVSLNGNPNERQNFHLLLKETSLTSLSLKFCEITTTGIEKISNELSKPYDTCLLHLNLSSNSICDEGTYYIAQFLRINRILLSLNLADNKIYDEGCLMLTQPLQKFQLTLEEIIVRRRIRFSLLQKKQKVLSVPLEIGSRSSSKISSKSSKDKTENSDQSSIGSKSRSVTVSTTKRDAGNHPFVEDSYEENKEIYCKGNYILLNLNLSYNRITKEGLTGVIQMMTYQTYSNMFANDKGISRISVEGNDFRNNCEQELQELEKLLTKKSGLSSSSTSTSLGSKKKSQSSLRRGRSSKNSLA